MQYIEVDDKGTKLSYIDSGVPSSASAAGGYITIFALHGTVFTSPIFSKAMEASKGAGIRFVAVNRRDYPGSTPFSPGEMRALTEGTDEERADFVRARGLELITFITRFVENEHIAPISEDKATGGFGIVGWSLGNAVALAAVSNLPSSSGVTTLEFGSYLRGLVLYEPPTLSTGMGIPPKAWSPHIDTTVPAELRSAFFAQWITSYFKHGDLSKRDLDKLSYIVPSTTRAPSIFGISEEQQAEIIHHPSGEGSDMSLMLLCGAELNASYKRACFDKTVRETVPHMTVTVLYGDLSAWSCFPTVWQIQDDDAAHGGGMVKTRLVEGTNHFMHWDDPKLFVQLLREALV